MIRAGFCDFRQTSAYAKYMESIGWVVERIDGVNYFIKKFPIIGSFIKIQRPEKLDLACIDELIHRHRAFQVVIEPNLGTLSVTKGDVHNLLLSEKYKISKSPFAPAKTIHIDLTKSEEKLLKEMHYKTRYNIKKAISKAWSFGLSNKLKVISSDDINTFANFWQECARKQRKMFLSLKSLITKLYQAFGDNSDLIFAFKDSELIAAVFTVSTKDTTYYMYAAASDVGKKLFAPTLVAWNAIKLAKKRGKKIFDFEGIYDPRFPLKSWKGFTRFKKSFGGYEVSYPGAFVKNRFPI